MKGPGTENATPAIGGDTDMINEDTNITQKTPPEDNVNVESHDDEQNVDVDESSVSKYLLAIFFILLSHPSLLV